MCQLHQASYLWWEAECLQEEMECLEAKGLQKRIFSTQMEGPGPLQHSTGDQDTTRAIHIWFPPLAKRHRCAPTEMVSSPTAQEPEATATDLSAQEYEATTLDPTVQEFKGACWKRGPSLTCPHPIEADTPTTMASMWINVSDTQQVYCCQAKGYPEGPSTSHATIFFHVHHTHLGMKLTCPFCPTIFFFNFDTLKQQGKQAHHTAFSCLT